MKLPILCVFLSILPVLRILWLIENTCVNLVSVDFSKAMNYLNRALSGDLWQLLCFPSMSGHPQLIPLLFHYVNAKFFGLNAFYEYYLSIFLLCLATILAFDSMRSSTKSYGLLPALTLLQFNLCLSSEFFYCYSMVLDSLTRVALSMGIWSIAKVKNRYLTGLLMIMSGFVCSSCFASMVVSSWAAFAFLIFAIRRTERALWGSWIIGFLLSATPIIVVYIQGTFRSDPTAVGLSTIANFLATIGMVFLNNTANSVNVDWKSTALGLAGVIFPLALTYYFTRREKMPAYVYCALAFGIFGILNTLAVAIGRIYISPWYCSFGLFVWSSTVALAWGVLSEGPKVSDRLARCFALFVLSFCFVGYVNTNLSYADKDYFRMFHSPSAASCLRHYKWAPTYAYYQLFGSKMGSIETFWNFGSALAEHSLSCFAENQVWSMQGDFILPTVQFRNCNKTQSIRWILGTDEKSHPSYSDPEHLTLQIPQNCSASWTLCSSEPLISAVLEFEARGTSTMQSKEQLKVYFQGESPNIRKVSPTYICPSGDWRKFSIPIDLRFFPEPTIVFENRASANTDTPVLLRYPRISVHQKNDENHSRDSTSCFQPSNVDSYPDRFGTVSSVLMLDDNWKQSWCLSNLENPDAGPFTSHGSGKDASLTYLKPLNIEPSLWSEFFVEFARNRSAAPRIMLCQFFLADGKLKNAVIPILPDEQKHRYSFELKLLQLRPKDAITFLKIIPLFESDNRDCSFEIGKLGFTKRLLHGE